MDRPKRQERILSILGMKNGLTAKEIINLSNNPNTGKIGRSEAFRGLNELLEQKIITRDESKKYFIQTETKNKTLLITQEYDVMKIDVEESMKELKEYDFPFILGRKLLRAVMFDLQKFTLERHTPRLADHEKYHFDKLIERCNDIIEKTFDTLGQIDLEQTISLKISLDKSITDPNYPKEMYESMNENERRRNEKVNKKITDHLIKQKLPQKMIFGNN